MALCYIIGRGRRKNLFLTPFQDPRTAEEWNTEEPIVWTASSQLTTQDKDDALFTLYRQLDAGVDRWIQEKRYVPRLLLSACVFLVIYFFFSLAVRDPFPMVDELVLAIGGSLFFAAWLSRKDKQSDLAMKRRLELKQHASRADFDTLDAIGSLEDYLDTCAKIDTIELADRLALNSQDQLPSHSFGEITDDQSLTAIGKLLLEHARLEDLALYRSWMQVAKCRDAREADPALAAKLLRLSMRGSLDLPLLALMIVMKVS